MKSIYTLAAALMLVSQSPSLLRAEYNKGPHDMQKMEEMRDKRSEKRLAEWSKDLKLSKDQEKSIKAIWEEKGEKMETVRKETAEKMKAIHEESTTKIKAVLTDAQKTKFDAIKDDRKKERMERHPDDKK